MCFFLQITDICVNKLFRFRKISFEDGYKNIYVKKTRISYQTHTALAYISIQLASIIIKMITACRICKL